MKSWTAAFEPMSMPLVGSSRITTFGFVASHLAITTFCWLPPESSANCCSQCGGLHGQPRAESARRVELGRGATEASPRTWLASDAQRRCSHGSPAAGWRPGAAGPPAHRRCRRRWPRPARGSRACGRRASPSPRVGARHARTAPAWPPTGRRRRGRRSPRISPRRSAEGDIVELGRVARGPRPRARSRRSATSAWGRPGRSGRPTISRTSSGSVTSRDQPFAHLLAVAQARSSGRRRGRSRRTCAR